MSNEYVDDLEKGKFEEAHAFFDESVKNKIRPDDLKRFWSSVNSALGAFESVENAQNTVKEDHFFVTLDCKFSKGKQGFQFVFNKAEKMVGFFMAPKSTVAAYQLPSYADSTLYREQSVTIKTPGHELAGILTTPKSGSNFPVVILVHGSGPADMDATIGPNKPFKDLAMGLAAKGVASIRYVKRSRVYTADFIKTAFTLKEEVTDDALAAVALARTMAGIDKKQIYVMGHSLGGMLAPKLATLAPDLRGIILAAAPARKLTDVIIEQTRYLFETSKDTAAVRQKYLEEALKEIERTRITSSGSMAPDSLILGAPVSYWIDLNLYDQTAAAKKLKTRMLVIHAENDTQVSAGDYNLWKAALTKKKNAVFKSYPELNHLLMPQVDKNNNDGYSTPANVSPSIIDDIALWINDN